MDSVFSRRVCSGQCFIRQLCKSSSNATKVPLNDGEFSSITFFSLSNSSHVQTLDEEVINSTFLPNIKVTASPLATHRDIFLIPPDHLSIPKHHTPSNKVWDQNTRIFHHCTGERSWGTRVAEDWQVLYQESRPEQNFTRPRPPTRCEGILVLLR